MGRRKRHWFRDLRISRKLTIAIVVHLLHATVLLVVTAYGMKALSASRAYVEGEGLWSRAEKTAVLELQAYAKSGDETRYELFLAEINVTLGDRQARLEMNKANPDSAVIRAGFLQGGVDAADISDMAWLYRNFRHERHLEPAIDIWRQGDENITLLLAAGERVHAAVSSPQPDPAAINVALEDALAVDQRLTVLERDFSRTLGDGVRWLTAVVTAAAIGLTVPFVGGAVLVSWTVARHISRSARQLQEGAARLAAGDLTVRVGGEGRDELAVAGQSFNGMAERLQAVTLEREEHATALRESLQRFEVLAEGSPLGVFHTDARGTVDYANARWQEISGCDYRDPDAMRRSVHPD
ncbi:MAG TPA: HAMP domain-containing protein, partial [Candidatus Thermoplasmatota archaeon]|nr:HAMP domain-containing protein [Candidatus Thermoplasmatota archaeon]